MLKANFEQKSISKWTLQQHRTVSILVGEPIFEEKHPKFGSCLVYSLERGYSVCWETAHTGRGLGIEYKVG